MSTIRIVAVRGVYKLCFVNVDADGDVESVRDEVEFKGNKAQDVKKLIEEALMGVTMPVVHVNSCNEKVLRG